MVLSITLASAVRKAIYYNGLIDHGVCGSRGPRLRTHDWIQRSAVVHMSCVPLGGMPSQLLRSAGSTCSPEEYAISPSLMVLISLRRCAERVDICFHDELYDDEVEVSNLQAQSLAVTMNSHLVPCGFLWTVKWVACLVY